MAELILWKFQQILGSPKRWCPHYPLQVREEKGLAHLEAFSILSLDYSHSTPPTLVTHRLPLSPSLPLSFALSSDVYDTCTLGVGEILYERNLST